MNVQCLKPGYFSPGSDVSQFLDAVRFWDRQLRRLSMWDRQQDIWDKLAQVGLDAITDDGLFPSWWRGAAVVRLRECGRRIVEELKDRGYVLPSEADMSKYT